MMSVYAFHICKDVISPPNITILITTLLYSQAVMKEAMRMHPGVAFPLERYVPKGGATISGTWLPEGTNVSVNGAVIHMDKRVFGEDAGQFRPERWLDTSKEQLQLMERSFIAVSKSCPQKDDTLMRIVWLWCSYMHW